MAFDKEKEVGWLVGWVVDRSAIQLSEASECECHVGSCWRRDVLRNFGIFHAYDFLCPYLCSSGRCHTYRAVQRSAADARATVVSSSRPR